MIEFSVTVIAAAFVVLVVFIILTLLKLKASLDRVNQTLVETQKKLDALGEETIVLIRNTNEISVDVQKKMKALDSFFDSARASGEALHQVTASVKQVSATVSESVSNSLQQALHRHKDRMSEVAGWAALGIKLWHQWKRLQTSGEPETMKDSNKGEDSHV